MIKFQTIFFLLSTLGILIGRRVFSVRLKVKILFISLWLSSLIAVTFPSVVQIAAEFIGIGRGADLVTYLNTVILLYTAMYLFSLHIQAKRKYTLLVRQNAILDHKLEVLSKAKEGLTSAL